jgi:serine/threonine protein kinase
VWEEDIVIQDGERPKSGAWGQVFQAKLRDVTPVAVKTVKQSQTIISDEARRTKLMTELRVLKQYRHQNMVLFYGHGIHDGYLFLVFEWMDRGTLKGCIKTHPGEFSWGRRGQTVALQVAQGLAWLHERRGFRKEYVVHFDM